MVAAYQSVYRHEPAAAADLTTAFTMATLASHGATQLLCGEADRILVDPYYVHNHVAEASTARFLQRWQDFLVEHSELLFAPSDDVTSAFVGPQNGDYYDVSFVASLVGEHPLPGVVYRRVRLVGQRLVMHLINLVGQHDSRWDTAGQRPGDCGPATVRARLVGPHPPRIRYADPDAQPHLVDLDVTLDGTMATTRLPAGRPWVWRMVVVESSGS